MKQVFVDTNAIMAIGSLGVDVFSELEGYSVVVLSGTILELERIVKTQKGKHVRDAKLGLAITKKKAKVIKSVGHVDDALVSYSNKGKLVLTQDLGLKRRLKKPYMTIRQKKKVVLIE